MVPDVGSAGAGIEAVIAGPGGPRPRALENLAEGRGQWQRIGVGAVRRVAGGDMTVVLGLPPLLDSVSPKRWPLITCAAVGEASDPNASSVPAKIQTASDRLRVDTMASLLGEIGFGSLGLRRTDI